VLPSLSIVIPAFNEAASIDASVRDALAVGPAPRLPGPDVEPDVAR